jgi:hypothetical protein
MLYDVTRLRVHGRKLAKDALRPPDRGNLTVGPRIDRERGTTVITAWLLNERLVAIIPVLDDVVLRRIRNGELLLSGCEHVEERRTCTVYPQAWWCVPVETTSADPAPQKERGPHLSTRAPSV